MEVMVAKFWLESLGANLKFMDFYEWDVHYMPLMSYGVKDIFVEGLPKRLQIASAFSGEVQA